MRYGIVVAADANLDRHLLAGIDDQLAFVVAAPGKVSELHAVDRHRRRRDRRDAVLREDLDRRAGIVVPDEKARWRLARRKAEDDGRDVDPLVGCAAAAVAGCAAAAAGRDHAGQACEPCGPHRVARTHRTIRGLPGLRVQAAPAPRVQTSVICPYSSVGAGTRSNRRGSPARTLD